MSRELPDKYDRAVLYLQKHPGEIEDAWMNRDHSCHCLFQIATNKLRGPAAFQPSGVCYGCLTQIRNSEGTYVAQTPKLTHMIQEDQRIPKSPSKIREIDLPVFAELQRKIDKELGRS